MQHQNVLLFLNVVELQQLTSENHSAVAINVQKHFNASGGKNIKMQQNFVCGKDLKSTKQNSKIHRLFCKEGVWQMVAWMSAAVPISHHYRFLRGRCGIT
jgi:hypothetical protein